MNYTISNEYYTLTVSDTGAEIVSITSASGRELMWQSPSDKFWSKHAPLLFPVCGRLKDKKYSYRGKTYDMGAHGFISYKTFTVASKTEKSITLCSIADEETLRQYPFSYEFIAEYTLDGDKILNTVTVKNAGDEVMPYMFGWHPAFALMTDGAQDIKDYSVRLGVDAVKWYPLQNGCFVRPYGERFPLTNGAYRLNEKEIYKNDTMIFTDIPTSLTLTADGHPYKLDVEWSANAPYLCIWKEPDSAAKFICLEPWSSTPADGDTDESFEERKMERLAPGAQEKYTLSLRFSV